MNIRRIAIFSFLFFTLLSTAFTQSGDNPFDIKPRVKKTEEKTLEVSEPKENKPDNPFDVVPGDPGTTAPLIKIEQKKEDIPPAAPLKQSENESEYSRFLFFMTIFSLGLFTTFFTFFRKTLQKVHRAVLNDNLLKQAFRSRETGQMFPFFMLYGIFFFNFGFFIFLLLKYYERIPNVHSARYLFFIIIALFLLYLLKHLVLKIIGTAFLVNKESSLYDFTIILFAILAGVLFLPANILIAYTDPPVAAYILWITMGLFVLLIFFRSLRGLFIGADFVNNNLFHFLLYICTVEIAPALILIRLLQNQYGA